MTTSMWKDDIYISPNIIKVFNKEIFEYDIHSAGYSITKEYGLLPEKEIKKLYTSDKAALNRNIGLKQRDDEIYKQALKEGFQRARKRFFEDNELDEGNVISVKKDAIFTTKKCKYRKYGEIDFRKKNQYSSYLRLSNKPNIEFYYTPFQLDIKGISDENIERHKNGIIKFIERYFEYQETSNIESVLGYLKRMIDRYKSYDLPIDYYRPFNVKSLYIVEEDDLEYEDYWEEDKKDLDISYNYLNVLSKLILITL